MSRGLRLVKKNANNSHMVKKLMYGVAATGAAIVAPLFAFAGSPMSTTTLAANIDSVSGSATDYIAVLLTNYWPLVLGFLVLIGVIAFGKRAVQALFH